jgi:dTDP-4-dehydrorhamnose 3,5-epimerase
MIITPTKLSDVILITPKLFGDDRGFFFESYNKKLLAENNFHHDFVQDNHSKSSKGVLRGLHYQMQQTQGKLVRVTQGRVFDVAVDMRSSSPTFGGWVGFELSSDNKQMAYIPAGFAHGFLTLSDSAEFLYKTTNYYAPEFDRTLLWNDRTVGIQWPLEELGSIEPQLSAKDLVGKSWADADKF